MQDGNPAFLEKLSRKNLRVVANLKQLSKSEQTGCKSLSTKDFQTCGTVNLDKLEHLRKRRVAKGYTLRLLKDLLPLDSPLNKSYQTSLHCSSVLIQKDGKLTSRYCGHRWCYVCNRIRTAKLINGYKPVLQSLPELRFVTLTRPNVPASQLKDEVQKLISDFRRLRDRLRKQKILLRGVRKLEITYNQKTKDFHPHFHCLISGELEAQILIQEWLTDNPMASIKAQDDRPADESSLSECFKYVSKLADNTGTVNDTIFQSVRNVRLVQSMGGIKQINEEIEALTAEEYELSDDVFIWNTADVPNECNWYSVTTGIALIDLLDVALKNTS